MSALSEPYSWSRVRWVAAIALVLALQLGCIFFLSSRSPVLARTTVTAPVLHIMAKDSDELLALHDPTLFALPHEQGFSGQAWLQIPPLTRSPFEWSEPLRWLSLPVEELGQTFHELVRSETVAPIQFEAKPEPRAGGPEITLKSLLLAPSALRLEGELAKRRLLTTFNLPPQTNSDILTNSVVQVLVGADGNVLSATLLPPGCGQAAADQSAMNLAKAARFEPLNDDKRGASPSLPPTLTLGDMVFQWQTVPPPATGAPAATP